MCIGIMFEGESSDISSSSEERKTTGRMMAVIGALLLLALAMYHAWIRKTAVLAGVIVPAAIMILYAAWVLFLTKRDKKRFLKAANEQLKLESLDTSLAEVISTTPTQLSGKIDRSEAEDSPTSSTRGHSCRKDKDRSRRHGYGPHTHGRRAKKSHEKFLKTKRLLLAQQAELELLKPSAVNLHRSVSVS